MEREEVSFKHSMRDCYRIATMQRLLGLLLPGFLIRRVGRIVGSIERRPVRTL